MTAVLDSSVPITYDWNEPVSPTAMVPTPVISPELPAEDEAEVLRSVSQSGEGSEADPRWRAKKERHFTSWIAEDFSTHPDASLDLEQIDKTRKESLSEALQTALQNVLDISRQTSGILGYRLGAHIPRADISRQTYNILTGPSLIVFVSPQKTEHPSGAFLDLRSFEQFVKSSTEEDVPAPLAEALRDLREINDEADEEGIAPPSELAIANADRLLRAIYDISPRQCMVGLLPEGVIAIAIPGGFRCSVALLCESDGGALCSVNMNGKHRRKRYPHTDQLPDTFLREALSELGQE